MITPFISSDTHVIEPPSLWQERIDREFRDRAPAAFSDDDADWWYVDGTRFFSFSGGDQTGVRFEAPETLRTGARFANVRPGAYEPAAHLADNEYDGIVGSVLYPTAGLGFYRVRDSALFSAMCRAYNDWLAEFCGAAPDRLKGIAMLNVDDPDEAVRELTRAREIGLSGCLIPTAVGEEQRYDSERYERFWSAAEELSMPLSLHVGAYRLWDGPVARDTRDPAKARPSFIVTLTSFVETALADLIFAGVFDRHPSLRVGTIEHELGWIPHFLDRLDYTYTQRQDNASWYRFENFALPSEMFHHNVFCSFQEDALGIQERDRIGVDGLMFGSDYPHSESTFPRSAEIMAERLDAVPEREQRMILFDNVSRVYGFDLVP